MTAIAFETDDVDINGTHRQGYIKTSYHALVEVFGEPIQGTYKTDWEWASRCDDGAIATIYNWKNGPNYGYSGVTPEDIDKWNVGGFKTSVLFKLLAAVDSRGWTAEVSNNGWAA